MFATIIGTDTRAILPTIKVPTLVLHASDNPFFPVDHGRYLASHIPGAAFVEVLSGDHAWSSENGNAFIDEVEHFVTRVRRGPDPDRVLATVMFTDIVSSTQRVAALGDRRWRELLETHRSVVRRELQRHRGREVNTIGDGFLAIFDGPARRFDVRARCFEPFERWTRK